MAKYDLYFTTTASTQITIEADSLDEAVDLAYEDPGMPTICAQCSGWGDRQNLDLGEWEFDESEHHVDGERVSSEVSA